MTDTNPWDDNPFLKIGAPHDSRDPEAGLAYLRDLAAAFESSDHQRLKPIKRKLGQAFKELEKGRARGVKDEILGKKLSADIYGIRLQLYSLISTLVSQLQVKVKAAVAAGVAEGEQADANQMLIALDALGKGMRSLINAMKKKDDELIAAAGQRIAEAQQLFRSPSAP